MRRRSARMLPGQMYFGCSGVVVAADGGMALRGSASGALAQAELIGRQVAADLLSRGAGRYMAVSGGHLSSGDDDK